MSELVFAYGSNMCSGRFRDYGVSPEAPGTSALLAGYHLLFNKQSTDGSGKANVEMREGSHVWGVLYSIPDADLPTLDAWEVGYHRVPLPVHLPDNGDSQAWVYIASTPNNDHVLRPYTWYKRFLVEGAREHSLPVEYFAELENIAAVQDANAARDRRKRVLACGASNKYHRSAGLNLIDQLNTQNILQCLKFRRQFCFEYKNCPRALRKPFSGLLCLKHGPVFHALEHSPRYVGFA
jgi:hypothetical protein